MTVLLRLVGEKEIISLFLTLFCSMNKTLMVSTNVVCVGTNTINFIFDNLTEFPVYRFWHIPYKFYILFVCFLNIKVAFI